MTSCGARYACNLLLGEVSRRFGAEAASLPFLHHFSQKALKLRKSFFKAVRGLIAKIPDLEPVGQEWLASDETDFCFDLCENMEDD